MKEDPINGTEIVLAIETSGRVGSIALGRGGVLLAESTFSGFMKQSAELLPQVQLLLDRIQVRPCDIRKVFITAGPGSFTGLRIAVTAAKMMYLTHQVAIVAADSTDVIAENAPAFLDNDTKKPIDCICTILDAKRNLFYTSVFERQFDGWTKIFGTQAVTSEKLMERLEKLGKKKVYFLGEGLVYYAKKFESSFSVILDEKYWAANATGLFCIGHKLARQGKFTDPKTLTPLYIRKPEAVENRENCHSEKS